jgi:hypothetical protein
LQIHSGIGAVIRIAPCDVKNSLSSMPEDTNGYCAVSAIQLKRGMYGIRDKETEKEAKT